MASANGHEGVRGGWIGGLAVLAAALAGAAFAAAPEPPARLADTGLYAVFATRTVAPGVLSFSPQYPLWTDGATKRRWIALPAGTWIDASDPDAWVFPVGTRIWKEFSFGRPVETRYMELGPEGWRYATYLWSADGSEALLAPARGVRQAAEIRPGVAHALPSRYDCASCHQGNRSAVLGFSALQLSSDRDPLAPHAEAPRPGDVDLATLVERGLVRGLPEALVARPPRIDARSPVERAALGYLHGNCASCHNDRGALAASVGMSLEVRLAPAHEPASGALATALGRESHFRPAGRPATLRVAAGDPDGSVLLRRVSSRDAALQMPPFGTRLVDEEAVALLSAWIRSQSPGAVVAGARLETTSDEPHDPISREKGR
jgi:mono/diheme cytochrome c family protein